MGAAPLAQWRVGAELPRPRFGAVTRAASAGITSTPMQSDGGVSSVHVWPLCPIPQRRGRSDLLRHLRAVAEPSTVLEHRPDADRASGPAPSADWRAARRGGAVAAV